MTAASGLRHCVTLLTFDKQSNGRRKAVESKSNRSCNHRITSRDGAATNGRDTSTR